MISPRAEAGEKANEMQSTEYQAVYGDGENVEGGLSLKEARELIAKPPANLTEVRKWVRHSPDGYNEDEHEETVIWSRRPA